MLAKELDEGIESGTARGVPLPANAKFFIADVLPEISVPIRIPTTSVSAIDSPAIHFLCRLDPATSRTWSLICSLLLAPILSKPFPREHTRASLTITLHFAWSCPAQSACCAAKYTGLSFSGRGAGVGFGESITFHPSIGRTPAKMCCQAFSAGRLASMANAQRFERSSVPGRLFKANRLLTIPGD